MEKQAFLWFLEKEEVNRIFSVAKLQQIQATVNSQLHRRKKCLCLKNSYKNKSVFLKKGKIEIIKESEINGEKKQWTVGILYAGAIWSFNDFGKKNESQPQREARYIISVLKDSEFCLLNNLGDLFINEKIYLNYLKIFAIQRKRIEKRVEDYIYKDARTRVIEYVLCQLTKRGQSKGNFILLKPFVTHKELGKLTATTRQIVTTILNSLRRKQILAFDRNILIVKNRESLQNEIKNKKNRLLEIQKNI